MILAINLVTSLLLMLIDYCHLHTWFLLNSELARTKRSERYLEKSSTFYEQDYAGLHLPDWLDEFDTDFLYILM